MAANPGRAVPTPFDVVKQIQQRAQDTGQKIINPIVKSAAPADITDIVKGIDDVVGRAERSKLFAEPLPRGTLIGKDF
jgi:hypothetical protein